MRPCNPTVLGIPRCPYGALTDRTRCTDCERAYQRSLGTTTQRGYGSAHQQAREQLRATLPAPCGYCGVVVQPDEDWDAAHVVDGHPEMGWCVAHPACNQRAKVRRTA